MADSVTREIISVTHTSYSATDVDIGDEYATFVKRALQKANALLVYGPPSVQLALIKIALSSARPLAAASSKTELDVHRAALERMMAQQTSIDVSAIDALSSPYGPASVVGQSDDQDDIPRDEEV